MQRHLTSIALFLGFMVGLGQSAPGQSSEAVQTQHVIGQLVGELSHAQPGQAYRVGLLLKHDPHWHTYWKASATGYATSIDWDLPEGWTASEISWPTPTTYESQGFVEYVYEGDILLMVDLTPPADSAAGTVAIPFSADWLMCEELCIPGGMKGTISLEIAHGTPEPSTEWGPLFQKFEDQLPVAPVQYSLQAWVEGRDIVLTVTGQPAESLQFFDSQTILVPVQETPFSITEEGKSLLRLQVAEDGPLPDQLQGVLAAKGGWPGQDSVASLIVDIPVQLAPPPQAPEASLSLGLLVLAFIGGLILNLMPCVFPVIGIKIMGFVNQAGASRRKVVYHGLIFTLGVLASFWVLTTVLLALRSGGAQLGWGFQLQSPAFVLLLSLFLFAFALNLSGLFEVGQSAVGVGSDLTGKSGFSGTFFSGVLATVVATPCAAPFLAPALGAALTLPLLTSFLVFTVIGLGLSTPYLLLSAFPGLINKLPRPGPWMETFKHGMSFFLYATVAYLLWVLSGQLSDEELFAPSAFLKILFSLIILALGLWVYGKWAAFHRQPKVRRYAFVATFVLIGVALWTGMQGTRQLDSSQLAVQWEKWEPGKAEALAEKGHIVYVDFTARWCVTCQTNKAAVFSSDKIVESITSHEVILLKADWTNRDAGISEELQRFNRSAVPFNLIYSPGSKTPEILPEILTSGIVLRAIQAAAGE